MAKSGKRAATTARRDAAAGLSIIVPAFNEARGLEALHQRIVAVARRIMDKRKLAIEIVYVDDGSRDATGSILQDLPPGPVDIQLVTLSRNFGKEAALLAGLDHARHGAVQFIDGDGQQPPELIETLVARWLDDGYDVVYAAKAQRPGESLLYRAGKHWFYLLLNLGQPLKIPEDAHDFRLLSPRATAALRQMPERKRFFKGMSTWIGFRQFRVDFVQQPRPHGATKWNWRRLIGLSIDGLTSFTVAPLRAASVLGLLLAVVALVFGVQILVKTLVFGQDVPGYPSLFVGMMVLGSVQLIMIGVLGEYIGKVLSEAKGRPVYFVAEHDIRPARESAGDSAKPRAAASRAAE